MRDLFHNSYNSHRNRMVLVKFLNDTQVQPLESQWFQFYTPNQDKEIQEFSKSNAAVSKAFDKYDAYCIDYTELLFSFYTEKFGSE